MNWEAKLKAIIHSYSEAVNNRDFADDSPVFANFHEDFRAESSGSPSTIFTKAEYLAYWRQRCIENPDFHLKLIDIDISLRQINQATIFTNHEITGAPNGITRPTVVVWTFQHIPGDDKDPDDQGQWLAIRIRGLRGLNAVDCPL